MIYTLTLNPAVDYYLKVNELKEGSLNLALANNFLGGGKGVNISKVLNNLGIESTVLGFIGGFSGELIKKDLAKENILSHLVSIKDTTRINIKLHNLSNNSETEITGVSPNITQEELEQLINIIKNCCTENDILVCSGNIPTSLNKKLYKYIAHMIPKNTKVVLDTRGNYLWPNIYNNFLIKPNILELEEGLGTRIFSLNDIVKAAHKFINKGVENVIVSMGKEGSLLVTKDKVLQALPLKVSLYNSIGAGDSLVAGFIAGYLKNLDLKESFRLGVAASVATVTSSNLATSDMVNEYLLKVNIKILSQQ